MSVDSEANDQPCLPGTSLDREIAELRDRVTRLGSENARLRLLELSLPGGASEGAPALGLGATATISGRASRWCYDALRANAQ